MLVEKYMDNKVTAEAAAEDSRTIASKNSEISAVNRRTQSFGKSNCMFKEAGHADAGYAIDDINAILQDFRRQPTFRYSVMPNGQ